MSGIIRVLVIASAVDMPTKAPVMYMPDAIPRCLPENHDATILGEPTEMNGPPRPNMNINRDRVSRFVAKDCRNPDSETSVIPIIMAFLVPIRSIRRPKGRASGMYASIMVPSMKPI